MRPRNIGRRLALQYLFMADMNGFAGLETPGDFFRVQRAMARKQTVDSGDDIFDRDDPYQDEAEAFAYTLIRQVLENREAIDASIQRAATNWSLSRIGLIERNVIRIAAAELRLKTSDRSVIMDEAVELAKRFGDTNSGAFVNGVADKLGRG